METNSDFGELLRLFNAHHVEYLLVGAYALACHGHPRNTGDMDLWVKPEPQNARNIMAALDAFGFGSLGLEEKDFIKEDIVVQLGIVPCRINILTGLSGVDWNSAWAGKINGQYGTEPVWVLGKGDFIKNKKAIGRHKDLADVELLERS